MSGRCSDQSDVWSCEPHYIVVETDTNSWHRHVGNLFVGSGWVLFEWKLIGIHITLTVLLDKPITATHAEAIELGTLADSKNLVLYPYQNCRYNSDFVSLRSLLELPPSDQRSLGNIYEFESQWVVILANARKQPRVVHRFFSLWSILTPDQHSLY